MYMNKWKKLVIVAVGLWEILVFSGTILGWTSLKLMLQNEGIYQYKCKVVNVSANTLVANSLPSPTKQTQSSNETETLVLSAEKSADNSSTGPPPPFVDKFSLKINFTFINNQPASEEPLDGNTSPANGVPQNTIVIPFQSQQSVNQSFIYSLLQDPIVTLKTNSSGVQVNLLNGIDHHKQNGSTLEQFIHLYMEQNLDVPFAFQQESDCNQQDNTLNLAYSIGSFFMGASAFIWGFLLEKWGLRVVRLLINSMISIGAFLLCFVSKGHDWLLFPAILIMSLGGVPIRIANMQFSNLYPSKRSTIISVYSGAFSASSIIYVVLQQIYSHTGISFFWVNFILVALSLAMIPFTLFVLPADKIRECNESSKERKETKPSIDQNHNQVEVNSHKGLFNKKSAAFAISQITLQNYKPVSSPLAIRKNGFVNQAFEDDENRLPRDDSLKESPDWDNSSSKSPVPQPLPAQVPFSPPLKVSLTSLAYNLHQLWFSWMITYMLMYVGSLNLWTERVTVDKRHQSSFVNLYGMFQVLALVISPLAGLLMDWQITRANKEPDPMARRVKRAQSGFWSLFITTTTLLICVMCHYFDTQEFIYISIVFITVYRAFLLAVGSAFLRIRFHGDHFNRLLGIMSSVSAVFSLLQIPVYKWESSSESNVIYVNIFNTVVAILVMANPLYLLITPLQRYLLRREDNQLQKSDTRTLDE